MDQNSCSRRRTFHGKNDLLTERTYRIDRRTYVGPAPSNIHDEYKAVRSASPDCDGEPTDHVPKDTMTTEQQLDLATRMVLEQVLLLSDGDYKQSIMLQLPLHCVDGTAELNTAFGSIRERTEHSEENKIPSLRVVDLVANDSVRSIVDDRRNTCCQSEARRQGAEVNSGLHPIRLHRKETTFNDVRTTTANRRLKIQMNATLCAVYLFGSCASLHDGFIFSGSVGTYALSSIFSFQRKVLVGNGHFGHLVHALFFGI